MVDEVQFANSISQYEIILRLDGQLAVFVSINRNYSFSVAMRKRAFDYEAQEMIREEFPRQTLKITDAKLSFATLDS